MAKDADLTDRTRGTLVAQLLDGPNTVAILDGYAFHYTGTRTLWSTAPDDEWDIEIVSRMTAQRIGERRIDGTRCVVYRGTLGGFYAITEVASWHVMPSREMVVCPTCGGDLPGGVHCIACDGFGKVSP